MVVAGSNLDKNYGAHLLTLTLTLTLTRTRTLTRTITLVPFVSRKGAKHSWPAAEVPAAATGTPLATCAAPDCAPL